MTSAVRAALGLGSNLGDRLVFVDEAIKTIKAEPGMANVAVSSYYETDPVGGPEQPQYVNAVLIADTTLTPSELLSLAHRCEAAADRQRSVRWGSRTLDVDVLAYGDVVDDAPVLTLPHPRAVERAFVLVPWAELDPAFVVAGHRIAEWAAAIDTSGVRQLDGGARG